MCGRYTLERTKELGERFDAYNATPKGFDGSYNIAPGSRNPVVAIRSPKKIFLMKWGLIPFWSKDPTIGYKMINARSEGIEDKPAFRKPIKSQRCLVPATGFFEWKYLRLEGKEEKIPWYITVKDQEIFSMAGIYDIWKDAEGHETLSYSIITTSANKFITKIHDRMPVILKRTDEDKYLNKNTELRDILKLLRPIAGQLLTGHPVSTRVNSPKHDGPELIKSLT